MGVLETRYDECPACGFPTRLGKVVKGSHSETPYTCDEMPEIRVTSTMSGTVASYTFICPRCYYNWHEFPERGEK